MKTRLWSARTAVRNLFGLLVSRSSTHLPEKQIGQAASAEKSEGEAAVPQGDDPEDRIEDHGETEVRKPQEGEEP